ncbi:hypothetical protein C8F01DRAFT_1022289 [Mycena amicta]|nr:hypothetical protein C8F01DRAFT_1022289 [Mycena amicta]
MHPPAATHDELDAPSPTPLRVQDLWFPDATLVFQAENTQYRVYAGLLAARSSVFADMLAFPQPADADCDTVDGCPLIVLPDEAHDVTCFFRAIFDSSFFIPPFTPPPALPTLAAILRLSQKYDVEYLRQRCLAHLSSLYPATLDAWDARGYTKHILSLHCRQAPPVGTYPILPVLDLAREAGAPWIVPAAMYLGLCAGIEGIVDGLALIRAPENDSENKTSDLDSVLEGSRSNIPLTTEQRTLLLAYPALLSATSNSVSFLLSPRPATCTSPTECTKELLSLKRWVDSSWFSCHFPLEIWEEQDWETVREDVCDACVKTARKLHREARQKIWDGLPKLVGLWMTWGELEKIREEALKPEVA